MSKRKKHHEEHHEEHADETWLIPYSDLLTLLLALFIVLFASSKVDKKKMAQIEASFAAAFNSIPVEQRNGTLVSLLDDAKGMDLGEVIGLGSDSQGAVIDITNLNIFNPGSSIINEEALPIIKRVAGLLSSDKYNRFRIMVEGHTDDVETSENFSSRWELSSSRASKVVDIFVEAGLSPERFMAIGMADIAPEFPNMNAFGEPIPENRVKNRRIVIRIQP